MLAMKIFVSFASLLVALVGFVFIVLRLLASVLFGALALGLLTDLAFADIERWNPLFVDVSSLGDALRVAASAGAALLISRFLSPDLPAGG